MRTAMYSFSFRFVLLRAVSSNPPPPPRLLPVVLHREKQKTRPVTRGHCRDFRSKIPVQRFTIQRSLEATNASVPMRPDVACWRRWGRMLDIRRSEVQLLIGGAVAPPSRAPLSIGNEEAVVIGDTLRPLRRSLRVCLKISARSKLSRVAA